MPLRHQRRALLSATALAVALAPIRRGQAQPPLGTWPDRPIRLVIAWPPGGGNDLNGRILGERLAARLGQPVVVENRGGSNGVLGAEVVAKAKPDGYTLLYHSVTSHVVNPVVFPRLPYDTQRDFVSVAIPVVGPLTIQVSPKLGIRDLHALIAAMRAEPGRFSYGSFGNGSAAHLAGELLKQRLGLDMVHVPYRGGAQALTDTISGQLQVNIGGVNTTAAALRSGQVIALAVTSARRSIMLPEVPTVEEILGISGFDVAVVGGLWAPAATPAAIVETLAQHTYAAAQEPEVVARLRENGTEPLPPLDAEGRATLVAREAQLLGQIARSARVNLD
jgi:tripartite-type tricarboxylate transporter receptor subunit TctC